MEKLFTQKKTRWKTFCVSAQSHPIKRFAGEGAQCRTQPPTPTLFPAIFDQLCLALKGDKGRTGTRMRANVTGKTPNESAHKKLSFIFRLLSCHPIPFPANFRHIGLLRWPLPGRIGQVTSRSSIECLASDWGVNFCSSVKLLGDFIMLLRLCKLHMALQVEVRLCWSS